MTEKNINIAKTYYQNMSNKDVKAMEAHLHQDAELLNPFALIKGKEIILQAAKDHNAFFETLKIREAFGIGNKVMLVIDFHCPSPIGLFRTASLLTLENGLILKIELFYDTSLFATNKV